MSQGYQTQVLLDVETQRDFFSPGGSCYTQSASRAAKNVYRLFRWARKQRLPVMSTVLRVRPHELGPLADTPHCIDGTEGERKLSRTVMARRINLGMRSSTDLPDDLFQQYQQVIFEKRDPDLFHHAGAERLITDLPLTTFIVFGAGVAHGVVKAAIGLRSRGFGVICARDAVLDLGDPLAEMAWRRMEAKGVVLAETRTIVAPVSHRRPAKLRCCAGKSRAGVAGR